MKKETYASILLVCLTEFCFIVRHFRLVYYFSSAKFKELKIDLLKINIYRFTLMFFLWFLPSFFLHICVFCFRYLTETKKKPRKSASICFVHVDQVTSPIYIYKKKHFSKFVINTFSTKCFVSSLKPNCLLIGYAYTSRSYLLLDNKFFVSAVASFRLCICLLLLLFVQKRRKSKR